MSCEQKRESAMYYVFGLFFCITLLLPKTNCDGQKKNILILGGTGFLGGETTLKLSERGHVITLLNRGNTYYDSDARVKPAVTKNILCDREVSLGHQCKEFTANSTEYFDFVVDFSSYLPNQILEVVQLLKKRVGLYIFISTGAVYRVSAVNQTGPSRESDVVRPESLEEQQRLAKDDEYGDKKLACEEILEEQQKDGGFSFVNLRLAAVIGPRDTTFRWWIYQLWILTHKAISYPVHIPDSIRNELFSLVYVDDVADIITSIVSMDKDKMDGIKNRAFNLAFKEQITLPKIINGIAKYYGIDGVNLNSDDNLTWYLYPPGAKAAMDTTLAEEILGWNPTPWEEAVRSTCDFHHRAMTKDMFLKEKEMVLADMAEEVVPMENFREFVMNLKQHFGAGVFDGLDLAARIPDGAPEIGNSFESDKKEL